MFSVHTTPEGFKNATIIGYYGFVFEENLDGEFKKLRFQNVFRPHENKKPVFLNFSGVVWMGPKVDYHSEDIKARVSRLRLASFSNLIVKNSLGGKLLHF